MNLTLDVGHKYIEYYEDEQIQERIDAFGLQGLDLADFKVSGTEFYSKWLNNRKQPTKDDRAKLTKEQAEVVRDAFENEIGRIFSKRLLKEQVKKK